MRRIATAMIMGALLNGCAEQPGPVEALEAGSPSTQAVSGLAQHIVVFTDEAIPTDFAARVEALGGAVTRTVPQIGIAAVRGLSAGAAATLARTDGITAVEPDEPQGFFASDPVADPAEVLASFSLQSAAPPAVLGAGAVPAFAAPRGSDAPLPGSALWYPRQWNMRAIGADRAWEAGHLGSREVRVAIIDTGIDYLHPDLVGLVDLSRSKSFVEEEDALITRLYGGTREPFTDLYFHGTAAASIVGSNATILAGVNRNVTLMAVKVADRFARANYIDQAEAVVWAADNGADVISASGGGYYDINRDAHIVRVFARALNYAHTRGVLFSGILGNNGVNHDEDGDMVRACELSKGVCSTATGPTSAETINGPWTNVDAHAPYAGTGLSAVDVAAPGGRSFSHTGVWVPCTTAAQPPSPSICRGGGAIEHRVIPASGASFTAPHVAGLAALLIAQHGRKGPAAIRAAILNSADDLGEPGKDAVFGHGRISIPRALGIRP